MTITIQTSTPQETKQLLQALEKLNIKNITIKNGSPTITKGDKQIDPRALFGIWKNNPRTLEQVRSTAWKGNRLSEGDSLPP